MPEKIPVSEYTPQYRKYLEEKKDQGRIAPSTYRDKKNVITNFEEWCRENNRYFDLDESEAWNVDVVRDFFISEDTINVTQKNISHVKGFLAYIKSYQSTQNQLLLEDVKDRVKAGLFPEDVLPTTKDQDKHLSNQQIEQACNQSSFRGRLVIRFLFDTACRLGEMRGITPKDIEEREETVCVTVERQRVQGTNEISEPKYGSKRTVELTDTTYELLQEWIDENDVDDDGWVFPYSDQTYRNDIEHGFEQVGLEDVTPHWLRHNRYTRIKEEQNPVKAQRYLGHKSLREGDEYTQFDWDEPVGVYNG